MSYPPPPPPYPPYQSYQSYPGPRPRRPVRASRVLAGVGIALGAHLLTLVVAGVGFAAGDTDIVLIGFSVLLFGQLVVFLACLTVGIVLTVRGDGGIGIGLLIGWAVGVLVAPAAGFGMCVTALGWS